MTEYYVLMKTKGVKRWQGAFPIKKGTNREKAKSIIKKNIKKNKTYRIVTKTQLFNYIKKKSIK